MALPTLPTLGQNPWYIPRSAWDEAVRTELEGRLSEAALEAQIAMRVDPIEPDGGVRAVGKGELIINVKDFGAVGTGGVGTDDTAAIQDAIDYAYSLTGIDLGAGQGPIRGAVVYFPPGCYRTTSRLQYRPYVSLRGAGSHTSRLFNDTTDLFSWDNTLGAMGMVYEAHTSDIWFSTGVTGGHIFSLSGTSSGGLARTMFSRVTMTTSNPTSSIWKQRGNAQLIDVKWERNIYDTLTSRAVPAFDISVGGNDANSLQWVSSWCHSHGATAAPFFRVESINAWNYNLTFRDLVGEQNAGGFIHLYAPNGVLIEQCPDWDQVAGPYQASIFKIVPSTTSGNAPRNVNLVNSFRIKNDGGLAGAAYDIEALSQANQNFKIRNCTPAGLNLKSALAGDITIDGRARGFRIITSATTLTTEDTDEIVCNSASGFTLTLPTAISSDFGRQYRIKNVGAGTITIGGTVDGVVNPTIAQWGKMHVRTDGTNAFLGRIWFTV